MNECLQKIEFELYLELKQSKKVVMCSWLGKSSEIEADDQGNNESLHLHINLENLNQIKKQLLTLNDHWKELLEDDDTAYLSLKHLRQVKDQREMKSSELIIKLSQHYY